MYSRGLCDDENEDAEEGCSTDDEPGVRALELATRSSNMAWRSWIASLCCNVKSKFLQKRSKNYKRGVLLFIKTATVHGDATKAYTCTQKATVNSFFISTVHQGSTCTSKSSSG